MNFIEPMHKAYLGVAEDERMKQYLLRWRELLAEPPIVRTYRLKSF